MSTATPVRPITPVTRGEVDSAATLLGDAFADDAPTRALLQDRSDLAGSRRRLFRALLLGGPVQRGTVDAVRDPDSGEMLGVAIWSGPDDRGLRTASVPDYVRAIGIGGLARAMEVSDTLDAHRPAVAHWYLKAIGVAPHAVGGGIGGVLLRHRLGLVDGERLPAYLESSNDRTSALYRRHGFVPLTRLPWPDGAGPTAMWRPASTGAPDASE